MKKNITLFSLLTTMCLGVVAGCGEETYKITTSTQNAEYGYVQGAGSYAMEETVGLKIYPNLGCNLSQIIFTDSSGTVTPPIASGYEFLEEEGYYYYTFVVSNDTIGNYEPQFSCANGGPQSTIVKTRFDVTYLIDLNSDEKYDSTDESFIAENVNFNAYAPTRNFIGENKILWFTNEADAKEVLDTPEKVAANKAKAVNISTTKITRDVTFYGRVDTTWDSSTLVKQAIDNFYAKLNTVNAKTQIATDAKKIVITKENGASEVSFNYYGSGNSITAMLRAAKSVSSKRYFYIHDGLSFAKTEIHADPASELDKEEGKFYLSDVNALYYNEFMPEKLESYTVTHDSGTNVYVSGDYTYIIDREKGELQSFIKDSVTYTISESAFDNVSTNVNDFYTITLSSTDETLNNFLKGYTTLDKIMKYRSTDKKTLEQVLKSHEEIYDELSKYVYSIHQYNEDFAGNVGAKVSFDEVLLNPTNLRFVIKVMTTTEELKEAFESLANGDYVLTTELKTKLGENKETWEANGENILDDVSNPKEGETGYEWFELYWNTLQGLKEVVAVSFDGTIEYNEIDGSILIYQKNTAYAEFQIKLEDGRIKYIKHTTREGTSYITYTHSFEYPVGYEYIENLGKGGFVLNDSYRVSHVGSTGANIDYFGAGFDYSDDANKPADMAEEIWEFYQLIFDLKTNYKTDYIWNAVTKTFTHSVSGDKFELTLGSDDVLVTITYTVSGGTPVVYEIDYKQYLALEAIDSFIEMTDKTAYLKDSEDSYHLIESNTEKPEGMSDEIWGVLENLLAISESTKTYTYTYSFVDGTHTFVVGNDPATAVTLVITTDKIEVYDDIFIDTIFKIVDNTDSANPKTYDVIYDYFLATAMLNEIESAYIEVAAGQATKSTMTLGEDSLIFEDVGASLFTDQLLDDDNAVVRAIKKLIDIRDNPENYESTFFGDIKEKSSGRVIFDKDLNYYEEGVLIGELTGNIE